MCGRASVEACLGVDAAGDLEAAELSVDLHGDEVVAGPAAPSRAS